MTHTPAGAGMPGSLAQRHWGPAKQMSCNCVWFNGRESFGFKSEGPWMLDVCLVQWNGARKWAESFQVPVKSNKAFWQD